MKLHRRTCSHGKPASLPGLSGGSYFIFMAGSYRAGNPSQYFWRYYAGSFYETSHSLRIDSGKIDSPIDSNHIFIPAKFGFFAGCLPLPFSAAQSGDWIRTS
jgi:hypothetical protein